MDEKKTKHTNIFNSLQGLLQVTDANDPLSTGSFLCLDGGHLMYEERYNNDSAFRKFIDSKSSNFIRFPLDDVFYKKAATDGLSLLKMSAGDFLVWFSGLPHANLCPLNDSIQGELRRFVQYIAMYPSSELPLEYRETLAVARKQAAAQAVTAGHRAWVLPVNNKPGRKRQLSTIPKDCYKQSFTTAELHLLEGTDPSTTDPPNSALPEHLFDPGTTIDYRNSAPPSASKPSKRKSKPTQKKRKSS